MARKRNRHKRKSGAGRSASRATATAAPAAAAAAAPRTAAPARPRPEPVRGKHALDLPLLVLVIAGIAVTAYLIVTAWFDTHPAYCGADSGCDLVQSSRWSTFLGLPMALWGLLTYVVLARYLWRLRSRPSAWRMAMLVAWVGAGVSWFLTLVSVFAIEATCAYCLASFVIMNLLLVLLLLRRPAHLPEHRWKTALPGPIATAAAVVLGLHLHFSGVFDPAAGPEDPGLKALAVHLADSGARFYGAYWCPHCQDQKKLFGSSVERLPYVECTPEGRGGPTSVACMDANINDYPTWIIDGQRHAGVISPQELARLSKFRGDL